MQPAFVTPQSGASATMLPLSNVNTTGKPKITGTVYHPETAQGEPLAVHAGVHLTEETHGIALNVSESLKHLLKLRSTKVQLGSSSLGFKALPFDPHSPVSYDQNIPIQDRAYIHMSNDELIQQFVDTIAGFNGLEYDKYAVRPYQKVSSAIIFALERTGGRDADVATLRRAFAVLEPFYSEHNYAVREAIRRRPELSEKIKSLSGVSAESAVAQAMKGINPHDRVPIIEELIQSAENIIEMETEVRLATESAEFFADPTSITGNALRSSREEVAALANGRIYFKDSHTLLRHAPVGTLYYTPIQYKYYNPHTKNRDNKKYVEARVKYNDIVQRLYHYDTAERNMEDRSLILTMAEGYIQGNGAIQPYQEKIPLKVRIQNLEILTAAVKNAQRRMGG